MGANTRLTSMPDKLPDIGRGTTHRAGFHGIGPNHHQFTKRSRLNIEDVDIEFELPSINESGSLVAAAPSSSNQLIDEDEFEETKPVSEATKLPQNDRYCVSCADKAATENGKLTEKIMELRLEADRQKIQFDAMKRKLDNTSKELKTAQAMIQTLKDQNREKANRIADLTREATIGLWNREKKKLLQFADVREASLEYELQLLKDTSQNFKDRAMDRIQFLHDQVYKLKLRLNMQSSNNHIDKIIETAQNKLSSTQAFYKQELETQKEEFFKFRRNMVGMLAGFHKDFKLLTGKVDEVSGEVAPDFAHHAAQFDKLLTGLHRASLSDSLVESVEVLPEKFAMDERQKEEMYSSHLKKREKEKAEKEATLTERGPSTEGSLDEEDMMRKLDSIEEALKQSSREIKEFDENIPFPGGVDLSSINDSGISINDYEGVSSSRDTPNSSTLYVSSQAEGRKVVRFGDMESDSQKIGESWKKRRGGSNSKGGDGGGYKTFDKSVQTDLLPQLTSPLSSRRGKRGKKGNSRNRSATPTSKKKSPKKTDATARAKQEKNIQKEWFEAQKNLGLIDPAESPKSKKKGDKADKKHQNSSVTFTHLRELYGDKRIANLIDRTTGIVDVDLASQQFPNLTRGSILEAFTHFVQSDANNDFRLDILEVVRAISRATDQVVDPEEIKAALFELGVLETDELDFFDFLCIQETLTTGTFDKSKSKMLQMKDFNESKKVTVSKYCAVM